MEKRSKRLTTWIPITIESIICLKDSDSDMVKKYNAKDGVIMITTKEGAKSFPKEPKEKWMNLY